MKYYQTPTNGRQRKVCCQNGYLNKTGAPKCGAMMGGKPMAWKAKEFT